MHKEYRLKFWIHFIEEIHFMHENIPHPRPINNDTSLRPQRVTNKWKWVGTGPQNKLVTWCGLTVSSVYFVYSYLLKASNQNFFTMVMFLSLHFSKMLSYLKQFKSSIKKPLVDFLITKLSYQAVEVFHWHLWVNKNFQRYVDLYNWWFKKHVELLYKTNQILKKTCDKTNM